MPVGAACMAKIYGERWQISSEKRLGSGGQAEVFRVIDIRGEYAGEYALKRVLNPSRHERFRREIEAIRTIQHPNIIKLIDHSALSDLNGEIEKQFLVMPIAEGGDLSQPGRVSLYRGSIDGVIQVGKQLAAALTAAHAARVIHRDVKPANVLFTGNGHETWLSDFGICLLRDHTRLTEIGEVAAPRSFLAPELEDGGQLDVTPAADVYSLGKVLYYMISGGVTLPRERLDDGQYNEILLQGERHQLLYSLLREMICPLSNRLKSMADVERRLASIETWEKEAQMLPLSPQALAGLQDLQRKAQERIRVATENRTAREQEAERLERTKNAFQMWLEAEFGKVSAFINNAGLPACNIVRSSSGPNLKIPIPHNGSYIPLGGVGLSIEQADAFGRTIHILQAMLCEERKYTVTVTMGPPQPEPPKPARDHKFAMIPYYQTITDSGIPVKPQVQFFTKKDAIGRVMGHVPTPTARGRRQPLQQIGPLGAVTPSFLDGASQVTPFRASEWPAVISQLRPALQEVIDSFIAVVSSGKSSC
jgi:serine/threonine protein kinase